jgi:hypothetical protein
VRSEAGSGPAEGPLRRIIEDSGHPDLVDVLAGMPGADLTSLLLEVMRQRASRLSAPDLLRRYGASRFVVPGPVSPADVGKAERLLVAALPETFELVTLSPLVPFGTHAVLAPVDQNNVVSTVRGTEVAADPTAALALEAAVRRQDLLRDNPQADEAVRLAARQRVIRTQRFTEPGAYAHFELFALVTAGRPHGGLDFERAAAAEHAAIAAAASLAAGATAVEIAMTNFSDGQMSAVADHVKQTVEAEGIRVTDYPQRPSGRGYYDNVCFKIFATVEGSPIEVGDGGLVDWTQKLLSNRKERLFISGIGLERLVA